MTLGTHVAFAAVLYLGEATLFGYRPDGVSWLLSRIDPSRPYFLLGEVEMPEGRGAGPTAINLIKSTLF